MKSIRKILACIRQADRQFNLINPGDKIAVGVSGGKDSLVLAYSLILYQKFSQKSFDLVFVLLNLGFQDVDFTSLKKWFEDLGYSLHIEDSTNVSKILYAHQNENHKLPCSICSRMKKAAINKVAHEYQCDKVAFAHHADDAIETLWMNAIFGARLTTFAPKMLLEKTNLVFIRPLILARESTIVTCAEELHLPITSLGCPNDHHTSREDIKKCLSSLYHDFPEAKDNFLTMLTNYEKNGLWETALAYQIEGSHLSIRPVILKDDLITYLKLEQKMKIKCSLFEKNESSNHAFLLYLDEEPIGVMSYSIKGDRDIVIEQFSILEEKRKRGYGSLLLSWLEKEIFDLYNPCTLYIISSDEIMIDFLLKKGFQKENSSSILYKSLNKIPR